MSVTLDNVTIDKSNYLDVLHSAYNGSNISSDLNKISRVRLRFQNWESVSEEQQQKIINDVRILLNVFHNKTLIRFFLYNLSEEYWDVIVSSFRLAGFVGTISLKIDDKVINLGAEGQ